MKNFNGKTEYDIEHIGSYGRFSTGQSFPIEYIMTTFSVSELDDLSFAREIKPENLDFDLLLQRDIDEERVRGQMEPYLNPNLTVEEIKSKAVFFPPLLVAIVPTKNKSMMSLYPNEVSSINDDKVIREWKNVFKLTYFRGSGPSEYEIEIVKDNGDVDVVSIDREPIKLQTRSVKGETQGASLIVIDGQHRLYALQEVYKKSPELISDLVVPVCVLFSPNSTEFRQKKYGEVKVPTVPEVFRNLFVDVNTTMELVGGHFNILLSDDSIGSLACRQFCDYLLNLNEGNKALSVIEWNTKKKKDSTIIKRKYSLTSIGVIDLALQEIFSKNKSRTKYVLNLEGVSDELYPDENDNDTYPKVEWDRYSLTQKKIIEKQVNTYLIPSLYSIFFEAQAFKNAFSIYNEKLEQLIKVSESEDNDALEAKAVLNQILDYIPIKSGKYHDSERKLYKSFVDELANLREAKSANIISYAIFQRGLFFAWANILDIAKQFAVDPVYATEAFVTLLDIALKDNGYAFESKKFYMQHSVFSDHSIKAKGEVRVALGNLILSFLGNSEIADLVTHDMGIKDVTHDISSMLKDLGQTSAANFVKYYEKERVKSFKNKYSVDFAGLTSDERQELQELENQQKQQLAEVRQGKRNKENVEYLFDKKANNYIRDDVEQATKDLKSVLKYDSDIVGGNGTDENELF